MIRPDPLAPLPPRAAPGTPPPGPDMTVCSHFIRPGERCATPPAVILWIGCLKGEHAGPLAYCAHHATTIGRGPLACAQCGGEVRVMKLTSMDGVSTVWTPDGPPPELWRSATFPGYAGSRSRRPS